MQAIPLGHACGRETLEPRTRQLLEEPRLCAEEQCVV